MQQLIAPLPNEISGGAGLFHALFSKASGWTRLLPSYKMNIIISKNYCEGEEKINE